MICPYCPVDPAWPPFEARGLGRVGPDRSPYGPRSAVGSGRPRDTGKLGRVELRGEIDLLAEPALAARRDALTAGTCPDLVLDLRAGPSSTAVGSASCAGPATASWPGRADCDNAGAKVTVWLDARGELATEPPSHTAAAVEAGVVGTAAAFGLAGTLFGAGALVRWRLDRRRIDAWGREWDLVGPRWGNKTG
jgi:hypothetical protein